MKRALPTILTLSLLISSVTTLSSAFAQTSPPLDDPAVDVDDAAPVNRVARLSFVDGDVSFLRAGVTEWAPAVENLPLLAGDQIYTGNGARAEVQLARGNYIRLSEGTELTITDLSDTSAQFEIAEGIAIIRIERLATVFQRFEVDTPNSAFLVNQDGLYRVEVRGEKSSELIVRQGEAEVSTEEGSFRVRAGHKLVVDTSAAGRLELAVDSSGDDWDRWSYDRDTTIARTGVDAAPDYVATYETTNNDFYGVSDLSSYGTWTNYSSYGQCWIPRVSSDWAPYRSGQWLWIPAVGWTWLASERWGWAPYHYGRWAFLSGLGWAWIPGFGSAYRGYGYRDYRWRPALVYFFNTSTPRGRYIGWYPLAPGERWRRHDHDRRDRDNWRDRSPRDGSRRPDDGRRPKLHHAMTILPADGFAKGSRNGIRPSAPNREIADWISKDSRSGLPDITPAPIAASPELAENDKRRSRRAVAPAIDIIKRPVVTRNPKVDFTDGSSVARERRVISPRKAENITLGPVKKEYGNGYERRPKPPIQADSGQSQSEPGRRPEKHRVQLPSPSEKVDEDGNAGVRERKHPREGRAIVEAPNAEGGNNPAKEERRRARQEQMQTPHPKEGVRSPEGESDARARDKRPQNSEPKPRENDQPRNRPEDSQKSHERPAPAPRVEPKQERPRSENQARPERPQEKEHRQERQQQTESRKKS